MDKPYPLSSAVASSPRSTWQPGTFSLRMAKLHGVNLDANTPKEPHFSATRTPDGIRMIKLKTPIGGKL